MLFHVQRLFGVEENDRVTICGELEWIVGASVMAYFKVLS
jgi:hypothetical protein